MPGSETTQAFVADYSATRQHAANCGSLLPRVRDHIETAHQHALVAALEAYNAVLATPGGVHTRLTEAQTILAERRAEADATRRAERDTLARAERRLARIETTLIGLWGKARLSARQRQKTAQTPQAVLVAAWAYDLPLLERSLVAIEDALPGLEKQVAAQQPETHKSRFGPGRAALAIALTYYCLLLYKDPFMKGEVPGVYWLYVFFEKSWFWALLSIVVLLTFAVKRVSRTLATVFVVAAFVVATVGYFAAMTVSNADSFSHVASAQANGHVYQLAARYHANRWLKPYDEYTLFDCGDNGILCTRVATTAPQGHLSVTRDLTDPDETLVVRVDDQTVMRLPDCGTYYCIPTKAR